MHFDVVHYVIHCLIAQFSEELKWLEKVINILLIDIAAEIAAANV